MIKRTTLLNIQLIKKPSIVSFANKMSSIIISTIIILTMIKINPVYAMEHITTAGKAIVTNDLALAERIVQELQNTNLTREEFREVEEMLNTAILAENPNAGSVPEITQNPWTRLLGALSIAVFSTLVVYLIMRNWDNIRDFIWTSTIELSPEVMKAILYRKAQYVNDPVALQQILDYLAHHREQSL